MNPDTRRESPAQPVQDHLGSEARPPRVCVISASAREERLGPAIAAWAAESARRAGLTTLVVDLGEVRLPDDAHLRPGGGPRSEIATLIEESDGFVVVTPEYNHSFPGSLKRAIDWHYAEWMFKAATVVSYGAQGGLLATEHLRGVFAELHVVTTRRVVGLRAPWGDVGPTGFEPSPQVDEALAGCLAELAWWSRLLRSARRDDPFAR